MESAQSSTNQSPTETAVQQQTRSNNNKLFVAIVSSVLLTAVITGSVVYFWQKSINDTAIISLKQNVASLEKTVSQIKNGATKQQQIVTPTPLPSVVSEAANWKTYVNKIYGYSLKYPQEINAELYSMPMEGAPRLDESYSISFSNKNTDADYPPELVIIVLPASRYRSRTIKEVARENFEENKNLDVEITKSLTSNTFLKKPSYEFSLKGDQLNTPVGVGKVADGIYKVTWFKNKENYFAIYLYNDPVLQEILSTFKFTN